MAVMAVSLFHVKGKEKVSGMSTETIPMEPTKCTQLVRSRHRSRIHSTPTIIKAKRSGAGKKSPSASRVPILLERLVRSCLRAARVWPVPLLQEEGSTLTHGLSPPFKRTQAVSNSAS